MTRNRVVLGLGLVIVLAASVGGVWYGRERERQASYEAGLAALAEDRYADALTLAQAYPDDPDHDHLAAQVYLSDDRAFHDAEKGLALQRAAAEAGQMRAAYFLARYLLDHDPDRTQRREAFRYITKAAECGMPAAHFELGNFYATGEYRPPDFQKARRYFEFAAWAGMPDAQVSMAYIYLSEIEDLAELPSMQVAFGEAMVWLQVADQSGSEVAKAIFEGMGAKYSEFDRKGIGKAKEGTRKVAIRRFEAIKPVDRYVCGFTLPIEIQ